RDSEPDVRLRARRTLEEMGLTRQRFLRLSGEAIPPAPPAPRRGVRRIDSSGRVLLAALVVQRTQAPADDLLLQGLLAALPALAAGIQDPLVQNRLAAIDAIETLGPAGAPAAPALVRALGDPNVFVRWAAARTLGKVGPVKAVDEVPALAKLLG